MELVHDRGWVMRCARKVMGGWGVCFVLGVFVYPERRRILHCRDARLLGSIDVGARRTVNIRSSPVLPS